MSKPMINWKVTDLQGLVRRVRLTLTKDCTFVFRGMAPISHSPVRLRRRTPRAWDANCRASTIQRPGKSKVAGTNNSSRPGAWALGAVHRNIVRASRSAAFSATP